MVAKSCLIAHPDTADTEIKEFFIGVKAHYQDGNLTLRYEVLGRIGLLSVPAAALPAATDGLWRHTCFEAFIAVEEEDAYREFNFSPSGAWAAYGFDTYRSRTAWQVPHTSPIHVAIAGDRLVLTASIPHANLPDNPFNKSYRLGLSAVLETCEGELSYWSLCHPSGPPDFHHRSGFTLSFNMS